MTFDTEPGHIFLGGFADGTLKVWDRRLPAIVRTYQGKHQSWIQNVHWQTGSSRELVSARYANLLPRIHIIDGA